MKTMSQAFSGSIPLSSSNGRITRAAARKERNIITPNDVIGSPPRKGTHSGSVKRFGNIIASGGSGREKEDSPRR